MRAGPARRGLNRIVTLKQQTANAITQVNALLNLPADVQWESSADADLRNALPTLDEPLVRARVERQELLIAEKQAELAETMVRLREL